MSDPLELELAAMSIVTRGGGLVAIGWFWGALSVGAAWWFTTRLD